MATEATDDDYSYEDEMMETWGTLRKSFYNAPVTLAFNDSALQEMGQKNVTYAPNNGIIDMTRIRVTGSLSNLVNMECQKVNAVQVFVVNSQDQMIANQTQPFDEQRADSLEDLDMVLDGLNDICERYTVRIRLYDSNGEKI